MRELFPPEPAARRTAGNHTASLDDSTVAELERAAADTRTLAVADITGPRGRPPD